MTFLTVIIGWMLVLCDLFFFPSLFHFAVYVDLAMIWILFSMDIQEEDSIYTFLSVLFMKTLFLSHTLVIPYLLSLTALYCLYYFALPFFYQKESWLSFMATQVFFISYLIWLYHFNWNAILLSCFVEIVFYFLLFLLRKALQTSRKTSKSSFFTAS